MDSEARSMRDVCPGAEKRSCLWVDLDFCYNNGIVTALQLLPLNLWSLSAAGSLGPTT